MSRWLRGLLQFIAAFIGLGLLWHVLSEAKPVELMYFLNNLSASAWFLLFFYFFPYCLDTKGWLLVWGKKWKDKIPYWSASTIRLQGEAFNMITPGLDIGGEPLKIELAARHYKIPKKVLVSSMFVHRTLFLLTAIPFIFLGLILFHYTIAGYTELKFYFFYGLLAYTFFVCAFVYLQQKNLYLRKPVYLGKEITKIYKKERGMVYKASFLHFVSWIGNAVEAYLMLHVAGVPVSFIQALMLESLVQLIRTASCFIPGSLGAQEGAYAYLAQVFGFPSEAGIAISLFKRARQIVWMLAGFTLWGVLWYNRSHGFHIFKNHKRRIAVPQSR